MTLARLPDDEDWLLRPVLAGHISVEALVTPGLGLEVFALLNDAMDVAKINEDRLSRAMRRDG